MPIQNKTYGFESPSDVWTFSGVGTTGYHNDGDGSPTQGCMEAEFSTAENNDQGSFIWTSPQYLWTDLGVPYGMYVRSVNASFRYQVVLASGTIDTVYVGPLTLVAGSDTTLEQSLSVSAPTAFLERNSTGYVSVPAPYQGLSNYVQFNISGSMANGAGASVIRVLLDAISLDMLYESATTTTKSLSGSIAFSGAVTKIYTLTKVLLGYLTPIGTAGKRISKTVGGVLAGIGALSAVKNVIVIAKALYGFITPSGTLAKLIAHTKLLFGYLNSSGVLTRHWTILKELIGYLTPVGWLPGISDTITKALSGTLNFVGVVTKNKIVALIHKTIVGFITPVGTLMKNTHLSKLLGGAIDIAGTLVTRISGIRLGGTLTLGGLLSKFIGNRRIASIMGITSRMAMVIGKQYYGSINFRSRLNMIIGVIKTGSITMQGGLTMHVTKTVNLSGEIGATGAVATEKSEPTKTRIVKFWDKIIRVRR